MSKPQVFRSEPKTADIESIREIVASTKYFHDHEIDVAVELVEERLERGLESGYHFLFAMTEGRTVGYSCYGEIPCTKGSYDLYWIAVHDEMRGRGLGKELLRATEAAIAALAGRKIWVETSSRELYRPTQAFYESAGYDLVARFPDFYEQDDDKLVYMRSALSDQNAK